MNDKTRRAFNVWLHLSVVEREELDRAIRQYQIKSPYEKQRSERELRESIEGAQKAHLGPLSSNICPYCGR